MQTNYFSSQFYSPTVYFLPDAYYGSLDIDFQLELNCLSEKKK
jgi:hypothetical protein